MRIREILTEAVQFPPVTFQEVMTPEYIESIFASGGLHAGYPHPMAKTNYHPDHSTRYEGWEQFLDGHLDLDGDAAEHLRDPKVQDYIRRWLPKRWDHVISELRETSEIRNGRLVVYRNISCSPDVMQDILQGQNGLGEYWSYFYGADYGVPWGNSSDPILRMTALVDLNRVDWITSLRRNMDYLYGEEAEIFLPHGTPVTLLEMVYDRTYGPADIQHPNRTT